MAQSHCLWELEEPVVFGRCCAGPRAGLEQARRLAGPEAAQTEPAALELDEALYLAQGSWPPGRDPALAVSPCWAWACRCSTSHELGLRRPHLVGADV